MRIPFFVSGAGISSRADDRSFVSLVDCCRHWRSFAAEIPAGMQGRLAPLLTGTVNPEDPTVVAAFDSGYAEGCFGGLPYSVDDRPPLHFNFNYDGTTYDELNTVTGAAPPECCAGKTGSCCSTSTAEPSSTKLALSGTDRGRTTPARGDPMTPNTAII